MQVSLLNKIVLITGGTGGLGSTLVRRFVEEKSQVIFTYHTHKDRALALEALGAKGYEVNLSTRDSVKKLIASLTRDFSCLDGIIHNAGVSQDHTIAKLDEKEFDETMEINLNSVFLINRGLLPFLEKSGRAKIIHVVSRTGQRGNFGQSAYAASKGGLIALTKTLAEEWGPKGISVNAITPGYLMSDMTRDLPEFVHEKARKESYFGTLSDAEEVAKFAAYLMSDHVTKVTGQVFHYDSRRN